MYRDDFFPSTPRIDRQLGVAGRKAAGRRGFLLHLRPQHYPAGALRFSHTGYLGFFATLLCGVEVVTGILLMLYYTPTPAAAYQSVLDLALIPFGQVLRDLHRLAGDLLVLVAFFHLVRVAVTGSYKGPRRHTWLTGVLLFLLVLGLAFSGYLLPWDQLSYWAVTVGTSLFAAIPVIGPWLLEVLRGGAEIGDAGLLRFYLLHVVLLPLGALFLFAVHYYQVARRHGISLPICTSARRDEDSLCPVPLWPTVLLRELQLLVLCLIVLLSITGFFYDAPLGSPANPLQTPEHTRAPWFFMWTQGLLEVCPSTSAGLAVLAAGFLLILFLPWYDRWQRRPLHQRPRFALALAAGLGLLVVFTFIGGRGAAVAHQWPQALLGRLAPEDGQGLLAQVAYDALTLGVYPLGNSLAHRDISPDLRRFLETVEAQLPDAIDSRKFPAVSGVVIIEPLQARVKKITLRLVSQPDEPSVPQSVEQIVYRHGFAEQVPALLAEVD